MRCDDKIRIRAKPIRKRGSGCARNRPDAFLTGWHMDVAPINAAVSVQRHGIAPWRFLSAIRDYAAERITSGMRSIRATRVRSFFGGRDLGGPFGRARLVGAARPVLGKTPHDKSDHCVQGFEVNCLVATASFLSVRLSAPTSSRARPGLS